MEDSLRKLTQKEINELNGFAAQIWKEERVQSNAEIFYKAALLFIASKGYELTKVTAALEPLEGLKLQTLVQEFRRERG